jgi:hypothetical protein
VAGSCGCITNTECPSGKTCNSMGGPAGSYCQ